MSKAEELSQNRYPTLAEKYAFIDGYEQAEKDNELTWEELKLLQDLSHEVFGEVVKGSVDFYQIYPTEQSFLEEILKRFKERKNEV